MLSHKDINTPIKLIGIINIIKSDFLKDSNNIAQIQKITKKQVIKGSGSSFP